MFLKRSFSKEIIDDFSITDSRIDEALNDLSFINKYLGGSSTTKAGLKNLTKNISGKNELKILDIGSGGSDDLLANNTFVDSKNITALDKNFRACFYLKKKNKNINVLCGDVSILPLKNKKFDIIHASLFLHHFSKTEIVKLIKEFMSHVNYGIIINDLRRSVIAYLGIKLLSKIFAKSPLVKNDGPLSVRRGFVKKELMKILKDSGINNFDIKKKWAFRWLIIIYSN